MSKLGDVDRLFTGRHVDREVIVLCADRCPMRPAVVEVQLPVIWANAFVPALSVARSDHSLELHHHGIGMFSQRVKFPVGLSGPSSATRTASRAPSATVSVPV